MRVLIISMGSRGDVAPYLGLGSRLRAAGHEVTLAVPASFADDVSAAGLGHHPLPVDAQEEVTARLAAGGTSRPLAVTRAYLTLLADHAGPMTDAMLDAAQHADVLLLAPAAWIGAHVAEGLGLPSLGVYLQPTTPSAHLAPWMLTRHSLGGPGNRAATWAVLALGQQPFRATVADVRRRLGLPPAPRPLTWLRQVQASRWPVLYGFSPAVVPPPPDWPAWHRPVGYWWPPEDAAWQPPGALLDFLDAGPPPVYVGFGSMPVADPARLAELVGRALREAGVRAVVHAGWAGLSPSGDDVLPVGQVPHHWLFPRVSAVVHHCGAGTTAAGLRAGVPAVAVPFLADQPFWAGRLAALGVSPEPVPFRRLTAGRLAAALRTVTTGPGHRARAAHLAGLLAGEDGAGAVVRALDGLTTART